ncbi:MAG: FAD-dependent oxidoreductase [Steroidobacteraceae bacterium]|nr:FAD-dependent oxidoreductase [Deltaproteobacteria bacterium]
MEIAIIGGGISGLTAAHLLSGEHAITLFEAGDYLGGHTHTLDVVHDGITYPVDTGFIVFNEHTYPNFIKLLARLGVPSQPSVMSLSVACATSGLQYCATSLDTFFAQRKNLLAPPFWGMLLDILRFKRACPELYDSSDMDLTLGEYLRSRGYSGMFIEKFLLPMGAAVWSADPGQFLQFPAAAFVRFFTNHGMLNLVDQPTWRTVQGGSRQYVEPLSRPFRDRVRLSAPVAKVQRFNGRVSVVPCQGETESFDHVIMACHSDQALSLLADPSDAERELLGAIPYQENATVLHTDSRLLPSIATARASWNCHLPRSEQGSVALTYWMNLLQSISAPVDFCVTLNSPEVIAPEKVIRRLVYHHPVYSAAAFRAQKRRGEISGVNRTSYCGAYWGWGFHEDGVNSALAVCRQFGKGL